MKKFFMSAVFLLAFIFILGACEKKEIASFEFSETDLIVLKGQDLPALKFTPIYKDESRGTEVSLKNDMITGFNKNTTGMQTVKTTHMGFEGTFDVFVADKIVSNKTELRNAINTQADGVVIAIKAGVYDITREDTREFNEQANYYFLITANNSVWRGFGNVTVKSTVESANATYATQNFVTVVGNNVEINNINLQSKKEANKVIEIFGENCLIRNLTIDPIDATDKFAGSIYLSCPKGTTVIEDVVLNYGRITTSGAGDDAKLTLRNVYIDYAKSFKGETSQEPSLWGFRNTKEITVTATNTKVTVSQAFKDSDEYEEFEDHLPEGITVIVK